MPVDTALRSPEVSVDGDLGSREGQVAEQVTQVALQFVAYRRDRDIGDRPGKRLVVGRTRDGHHDEHTGQRHRERYRPPDGAGDETEQAERHQRSEQLHEAPGEVVVLTWCRRVLDALDGPLRRAQRGELRFQGNRVEWTKDADPDGGLDADGL